MHEIDERYAENIDRVLMDVDIKASTSDYVYLGIAMVIIVAMVLLAGWKSLELAGVL